MLMIYAVNVSQSKCALVRSACIYYVYTCVYVYMKASTTLLLQLPSQLVQAAVCCGSVLTFNC
jgi:hypothetical protein